VEGAGGMAKDAADSAVDMGKEMTKDAMGGEGASGTPAQ
jgi:hypothetical protein